MSIPESQLEVWSHQGAETTARATHEAIRAAIQQQTFPPGARFEVFLQGSYKSATNIRGDSDVDLVAQLSSSFWSDTSWLRPDEVKVPL